MSRIKADYIYTKNENLPLEVIQLDVNDSVF